MVEQITYNRCMADLAVLTGLNKRMRIKKHSSIVTNSPGSALLFKELRCKGLHSQMKGNAKHLKNAEIWTWDEASRVKEGIKLSLKAERTESSSPNLYASFYSIRVLQPLQRHVAQAAPGTPQVNYDNRAPVREFSPCVRCRNRRAINNRTHTLEL